MAREFRLPDVGEGVHEGELVQWLVTAGDSVEENQPVAKVETDKALVDVPSPVDGTVGELFWSEGDVVPVGEVLLDFDVAGEAGEAEADQDETAASTDADPGGVTDEVPEVELDVEPNAQASATDEERAQPAGAPDDSTGSTTRRATDSGHVVAAPSTRRLARELGVDLATVEGSGPGGRITQADVRAAADARDGAGERSTEVAERSGQTESGAEQPATEPEPIEPPAATAGGASDAAPEAIDAAEGTGRGDAAGPTASPGGAAAASDAPARDRTLATPSTRRLAQEAGVDLDDVPAVEERDGEAFVTERAVLEYAEAQRGAQAADAERVAASSDASDASGAAGAGAAGESAVESDAARTESAASAAHDSAGSADAAEQSTADQAATDERAASEKPERREPYRGVRKTIGDAMARSKFTAPHVTHTDEVDVTRLVEAKEQLAERADDRGSRLTFVPFVLKAVAGALREYPSVNAQLDEAAEEIVLKEYYDLGVATATDAGLMVPVVEAADEKGLLELAADVSELTEQARERTIAPEDLRGSTFTVTNVGAIGGEYATPIVNYPEVAILALGQIRRKPRVVEAEDGEESIEPRSVLPLSLSFDHRVLDGAVAAQFTNAVRERLREPELLLLE